MSKDLFSDNSGGYAAFRPTYPQELYDFILKQVKQPLAAWDCACGTGQVAKDLAVRFEKVYATDHSASQITNAVQKENITYSLSSAEKTSFNDGQFDLVTVGQALHWFDIPAFFSEARRVLKPTGVVAVWGYSLLTVNRQIDEIINHFYTSVIGLYWDKERKLVDERYRTIEFPFKRIDVPKFGFSFQWTLDDLRGYLSTWSSVRKFIQVNQSDPVEQVIRELRSLWGEGARTVSFPLFMRMGKV
jgi:ubiquinone/menaquinone biosynthesis C-methylase UbiE